MTWPNEEKRTEQLNAICEESARLGALVSDILDYSKLQSGAEAMHPETFSGEDALGELVQRFALAAGKRDVALELFCSGGAIRFDRGQFTQVMNNLLDNAVRHAKARTRIRVSCEAREDCTRISVENQGEPIPAEELPKIWDRYHRAPQHGEAGGLGTGLGLAIVKSILERHGVAYGAESDEQRTMFWFDTMPLQ